MANYTDTNLLEARAKLLERDQKRFESRKNVTQAIDLFLTSTKSAVSESELERIRKSDSQATKLMYLTTKAFTVDTADACTAVYPETSDSGIVEITWAKKVATVRLSGTRFMNNEYAVTEAFANDLWNVEMSLLQDDAVNSLNTTLEAYLSTNRTQVNALSTATSANSWQGNPDYFVETSLANKGRFYNYMQADMMLNKYPASDLLELCNTLWMQEVLYYRNQGGGNSTNLSFQFDGVQRFASNTLSPAATYGSKHYIIPNGGVALLNWTRNDKLPSDWRNVGTKKYTTWQSMFYPELTYDVQIDEKCADDSGIGGSTQSPVKEYQFTLSYATAKKPLTNKGAASAETPIFMYQVKS